MVDQKTGIFHRHIARHLLHPLLIRMMCDSGQAYPLALQINEKQHVVRNQSSERKLLGYQLVPMEQDAA